MNENLKAIKYDLRGLYGDVTYCTNVSDNPVDISYIYNSKNWYGETIDEGEKDGLPNDLTKDDYFRIALLDVLRDISSAIKADSFVHIKNK